MALVLSACQTPPNFGEPEETFGAAVRHNIAVQTVDPHPQNKMPAPAHDAARAARSIARYQTDQVKKPAEVRTSDMGGGGGK
jgi:type IV pilus biogenesis protein CpaD/CtpE